MSESLDSRLFHTVGPETEKVRPLSFVLDLTVIADLVVDELSLYILYYKTGTADDKELDIHNGELLQKGT